MVFNRRDNGYKLYFSVVFFQFVLLCPLGPIVSCSACLNTVRNKKTLSFLFGETHVLKPYLRFYCTCLRTIKVAISKPHRTLYFCRS